MPCVQINKVTTWHTRSDTRVTWPFRGGQLFCGLQPPPCGLFLVELPAVLPAPGRPPPCAAFPVQFFVLCVSAGAFLAARMWAPSIFHVQPPASSVQDVTIGFSFLTSIWKLTGSLTDCGGRLTALGMCGELLHVSNSPVHYISRWTHSVHSFGSLYVLRISCGEVFSDFWGALVLMISWVWGGQYEFWFLCVLGFVLMSS